VARRFHYRGYIIKCYPQPVSVSGQWRLRIAIYTKTNGIFKLQPFAGPTVYASEDEVEILGIAYGQRIIDEKVPELKAG
jgi:hypothetical protein